MDRYSGQPQAQPISRQRRWQLRQMSEGKYKECGKLRTKDGTRAYCSKCRIIVNAYQARRRHEREKTLADASTSP